MKNDEFELNEHMLDRHHEQVTGKHVNNETFKYKVVAPQQERIITVQTTPKTRDMRKTAIGIAAAAASVLAIAYASKEIKKNYDEYKETNPTSISESQQKYEEATERVKDQNLPITGENIAKAMSELEQSKGEIR